MFNLTWEQAIEAMCLGNRVRHAYFTPEEWFEMRNGRIFAEDGCHMSGWYLGEEWQQEGWMVIENV